MRDYHEAAEEWEVRHQDLAVGGSLLCHECVVDTCLWEAARTSAVSGLCSVCRGAGLCATFEVLAPLLEQAVDRFYLAWAESGAYHDDGESSEETHDIQDILEGLLLEAVDVNAIPPLTMFVAGRDNTDYGWVRRRDVWGRLYELESHDWSRFVVRSRDPQSTIDAQASPSLSNETRQLLETVLSVAVDQGLFKTGTPPLWRGRVQRDAPLTTAAELGSPPPQCAADNRMTKAGDSVFYGAETPRGAAIEVLEHAPPDSAFCLGLFEATAPLYFFDAAEIPSPPSPFCDSSAATTDALHFLRRFAATVSQPNDGDVRHYVPTQVFTYFLRSLPKQLRPDAVRFASSLEHTSANWVVFVDDKHCIGPAEIVTVDDPCLRLSVEANGCFESIETLPAADVGSRPGSREAPASGHARS